MLMRAQDTRHRLTQVHSTSAPGLVPMRDQPGLELMLELGWVYIVMVIGRTCL